MRQVEAVTLSFLFFMGAKFRISLCTRPHRCGAFDGASTFPLPIVAPLLHAVAARFRDYLANFLAVFAQF